MIDNDILMQLGYGLYIVGARDGERRNAQIADAIMQAAGDPVTVAVSLNCANYTTSLVRASGLLTVGILPEDVELDTVAAFGTRTGREVDKLKGYFCPDGVTGAPTFACLCLSTLELRVRQTVELGSHVLFLCDVVSTSPGGVTGKPVTYAGYRERKAASFAAQKPAGHVCQLCGYVYDGDDWDSLPDDWKCPVCGVPKTMFS